MHWHALTYFTSLVFAGVSLTVYLQSLMDAEQVATIIAGPLGGVVISISFGYLVYRRWNTKEQELNQLKDSLISEQAQKIEQLTLKIEQLNNEILEAYKSN